MSILCIWIEDQHSAVFMKIPEQNSAVRQEIFEYGLSDTSQIAGDDPVIVRDIQLVDNGRCPAYSRGKRNSFSALAKWLEVSAMTQSAAPPATVIEASPRLSPQVEQAPYSPNRGICNSMIP